MAPINDELLQKLCISDECLTESRILLRLAAQKTGQGSGYELGQLKTGLPAVCAYIASKTILKSDEVTHKNAQVASCLKLQDFDKVLAVVETAIGGSRRLRWNNKYSYVSLIEDYASAFDRKQFCEWMAAVKRALVQSNERLNPEDVDRLSDWQYAIFFWTYNAAGATNITQEEFMNKHQLNSRIFPKLVTRIGGCCSSVKARIRNEIQSKKSPSKSKNTTTPTTTPSRRTPKKTLRILPTRDSPTKRKVAEPELPSEPETAAAPEHGPPSDSDNEEHAVLYETPSKKKRKLDIQKPILRLSPAKLTGHPVASSSRVIIDLPHKGQRVSSSPPPPQTPAKSNVATRHSTASPTKSAVKPAHGRKERVKEDDDAMDVDEEVPPLVSSSPLKNDNGKARSRRRFYPVYQDHKQWYVIDRRVKRLWLQAEEHKEHMIELYGHPLRSVGSC